MYTYDAIDQRLVDERVAQFRDQTRRYLAGELSEDDFRPLRLRNRLYIQRHAPMLRVAIPYGLLSSVQLRMPAHIARERCGFDAFVLRAGEDAEGPLAAFGEFRETYQAAADGGSLFVRRQAASEAAS